MRPRCLTEGRVSLCLAYRRGIDRVGRPGDELSEIFVSLRPALRRLLRDPGLIISAILCLGLGTGANIALFGVADALLNQPLPAEHPEELFAVSLLEDGVARPFSGIEFGELSESVPELDVAARTFVPVALAFEGQATMVQTELITTNYITSVLRPRFLLGRGLAVRDDRESDVPGIVISQNLWRRHFNESPDVIGRLVRTNGRDAVVVGVTTESFSGAMRIVRPDMWVPMGMRPHLLGSDDTSPTFGVVGRLVGDQNFSRIEARLRSSLTDLPSFLETNGPVTVVVGPVTGIGLPPGLRRMMAAAFVFLAALTTLLLAVAVVNVSGLLLIRGMRNQYESGVRAALGASKKRLTMEAFLESSIFAIAGVLSGAVLAWWTTSLIRYVLPRTPEYLEFVGGFSPDWSTWWFAVLLTVITTTAVGILPARRASAADPLLVMQRGGSSGKSRSASRVLDGFVVLQIAASMALVFMAGLLARSYATTEQIDPGFDGSNVVLVRLNLDLAGYSESQGRALFDLLLAEVGALPGVGQTALTSRVPLGGTGPTLDLVSRDVGQARETAIRGVHSNTVSSDYFRLLRIDYLEGAVLLPPAKEEGTRTILVKRTFAELLSADGDSVLGRQMQATESGEMFEIGGVVEDVAYGGLTGAVEPWIYQPFGTDYVPQMMLIARTQGDPTGVMDSMRSVISSLDRSLPVVDIMLMDAATDRVMGARRQQVMLFGVLALLALTVSGLGTYSTVAYSVASRKREFAVRSALGGPPLRIGWEVCRRAALLSAIGLSIGLPSGIVLAMLVQSQLYGVNAWDPLTILAVVAICFTTTLVASARFARTAANADAGILLRTQ